jgi:Asp-tRNA(Asn)/Glu-tRNA(Gln) amidotransferase A subunit family amidase
MTYSSGSVPDQTTSLGATETIACVEARKAFPVELFSGDSGVPIGNQIVGRSFDDARVFRAGPASDQTVGGFAVPPFEPSPLT